MKCIKCGGDMPPLPADLASMARRAGGVSLAHEVCPGETAGAHPDGRYFEVRVQIVEVSEQPTGSTLPDGVDPDVLVDELISYKAGLRAENLDAAMRPLALALGEKWQMAEKQANVADDMSLQGRA